MVIKLQSPFLIGREHLICDIARRGNCGQGDSARMCSMHVYMGSSYTADGHDQVLQKNQAPPAPCCLINTNCHEGPWKRIPSSLADLLPNVCRPWIKLYFPIVCESINIHIIFAAKTFNMWRHQQQFIKQQVSVKVTGASVP